MLERLSSTLPPLCGLLVLVTAGAAALPAVAEPRAVFILDASSRMSSAVDGASKMTHASAALGRLTEEHAADVDTGLVVYGAGGGNSCSDVATVIAPSRASASTWETALGRIQPGGATPLAESLRAAVNSTSASGRPMSVVLVAGGPDSCNADPCAMARTLAASAEDLTIHVVALAASQPGRLEPLACIAEETGGTFSLVRSRAALDEALDGAMEATLGGPDGTAAAAETETGAESDAAPDENAEAEPAEDGVPMPRRTPSELVQMRMPNAPRISDIAAGMATSPALPPAVSGFRAPEAPEGEAGQLAAIDPVPPMPRAPRIEEGMPSVPVNLAAHLAEDLPELTRGVAWRVYSARQDGESGHDLVGESDEAQARMALQPGEYIVHVAYGRAQATKRIQVSLASLDEQIVLNAGGLSLGAVVGTEDSPIPAEKVSFAIYDREPENGSQNGLVVPSLADGEIARLTEGVYHVVSRYGEHNAVISSNVRVEAGKLTEARVYHRAARITLKLVNEEGGEALADTSWAVLDKQGNMVGESLGAFPAFILAEGDYAVVARHGEHIYDRDFSVETGRDREVEVIAGP